MEDIEIKLQKSFFDLSLDLLCVAGTDGYLKKLNKRWEEILGHTEAEMCSCLMTEFIHPDDVESTIQVRKNFDQGKDIVGFQNRYRCKDGTYRKFEWTAKREGQFVIGVARDITNRFHKERLATIGQLAAGAGHEINNPLMIANSQVERIFKRMKDSGLLDDQYVESFNKYLNATERISKVISNLKQFSYSEQTHLEEFDLNLAIQIAIETVRDTYEKQQIKIILNSQAQNVYIKGQQAKLQQVMMNLLSNSKEALSNSTDKTITVSILPLADKVQILFEDNGPGVPAHLEDQIFNLFFTTKISQKASGMGLSLSQSLIRDYNGEINYIRKASGACIEIILPTVIPNPAGQSSEKNKLKPYTLETDNLKAKRILVVEDEPELAQIVKETLESASVHVDTAANGLLGLQQVMAANYDIIITDQSMPVMDGKTMIKNIFDKNLPSVKARIIIFTGAIHQIFSQAELESKYFKSCEVIAKPISQSELRRRVLDENSADAHPKKV